MAPRSHHIADVFAVLGIGILCLPILLLLTPYLEMGRSEARMSVAYHDVRRLRESLTSEVSAEPATLPERDPWGQPYQVIPLGDGGVRVLSPGPNQSSPPDAVDEDDIYSEMPESPGKAIIDGKRRQSLVAIGVTLSAWVLLASVYLRSRRGSSRPELLNRSFYRP